MIWKLVIGCIIGAVVGFAVGYAGRCAGGSCPLACNPFGGMVIGALMGGLIVSSGGCSATNTKPAASKVVEIKSSAELEQTIQANKPVLVDFYADWCGPCRALKPTIHALAEEYDGKAAIVSVNVESVREASEKHGISSIPDVRIFRNGKQVEQLIGVRSQAEYRAALDKAAR